MTLKCPRQTSELGTAWYWIRLVSGNFPEYLGGTFTFEYEDVKMTPRITAAQGPGTFLLHISKIQRSDTGIYYCVKVKQLNVTFLKGVFLRIKGKHFFITI